VSDTFLYFAYGSNMLTRRLTLPARAPSAVCAGTGYVECHRLAFDKVSRDGSGKADIEATRLKSEWSDAGNFDSWFRDPAHTWHRHHSNWWICWELIKRKLIGVQPLALWIHAARDQAGSQERLPDLSNDLQ
jgi:hypothetical protein